MGFEAMKHIILCECTGIDPIREIPCTCLAQHRAYLPKTALTSRAW